MNFQELSIPDMRSLCNLNPRNRLDFSLAPRFDYLGGWARNLCQLWLYLLEDNINFLWTMIYTLLFHYVWLLDTRLLVISNGISRPGFANVLDKLRIWRFDTVWDPFKTEIYLRVLKVLKIFKLENFKPRYSWFQVLL